MTPSTPSRHNCFTLLRWLFALCVVFVHSYHLLGKKSPGAFFSAITKGGLAELAVIGFFALSGYLNYQSLQRAEASGVRWTFLAKRFFRIAPLLWITFLVGVILSWCFAGFTSESFQSGVRYWCGNAMLYQPNYQLPGLFQNNLNQAFCGSVWTLPYEVWFYLLIAVMLPKSNAGGRMAITLVIVGFLALAGLTFPPADAGILSGLQPRYLGLFAVAFGTGLAAAAFPQSLQSRKWPWVFIVGMPIIAQLPCERIPLLSLFLICGFSYLILRLGQLNPGPVGKWFDRWDASYGIYLLSFPIQQALIAHGYTKPLKLFWVSAGLSIAAGLLTWRLLERPCLKFGQRLVNGQPATKPSQQLPNPEG